MKDRLHPAPAFPPHDPVFTTRDKQGDFVNLPSMSSSVASTPHLVLSQFSQGSHTRHSQVELMSDYDKSHPKDNTREGKQDSQSSEHSPKQSVKPTVHYSEDVHHAPASHYYNSPPRLESRPSSVVGTDDDDDDEQEFDWSGDEDLVDEEAKFEKHMGAVTLKRKSRRWGFWRLFTLLFSSLIGSTFLAGVLVTPALLIHFFWYKPHPTDYRRYVDQNVEAWLFWAAANVVISWGLAMIVDIIPVVARTLISISWGHVSEEVKSQIELYGSIKDTIKPLLYAASAWLSWIILFQNIFQLYNTDGSVISYAAYTDRVAEAIEFLFFFALVICAQGMLSHAIAFAFHRTAYRERLEEVKTALCIIEKLRDYKPPTRQQPHRSNGGHTPMFSLGFMTPFSEKEPFNYSNPQPADDLSRDNGGDADVEDGPKDKESKGKHRQRESRAFVKADETPLELPGLEHQLTSPNNSATNSPPETYAASHRYPPRSARKRVVGQQIQQQEEYNPAIQAARAIKSAVLHDARNIKGNSELNGSVFGVNSSYEAKRLSRAIYKALRDRHRTYLIPADFQPAFGTREEAQEAFRIFDRDNNGDISRSEIKATILRVYKERRFLSRSMRDVGAALKTLNQILLLFALVVLFFISLSVFGVNVTQSLTSVYSLGIAASFVFRSAASNMFDAIMFLFVTHPFDTGDRCFIDTDDNLIVKKMGLFATVFTRSDGTETYYSNSQLFTKFITNVRRSDKMAESLTMQVAWRTPLEKLDALEARLNGWLATEENRWFQPTTSITLQNIIFQRHLELTIGIPHNSTWQDWGLRNTRRTAFHAAVQYYCRQLDIVASESPMPIVHADSDTQRYTPPPAFDADGEVPDPPMDAAPKHFLGFTPPDQPGSHSLRARKSKSRKAALRSIGADGGDN
ncbi:hypothetical protein PAXRUDRAFT_465190 [Paxillus rubicundulus Ve08.2h10]|uniref:EF-hand domain-containing protein n=1 Tax=Paxillus rubicundulus Ve08.2h10 TaxID=930991 RepID=A0A0D0ECN7_9AGAM|nr:hypothetical protein PAXRUDRAFT_465190 [Paxillus rubicundulus Ve08.2h10]